MASARRFRGRATLCGATASDSTESPPTNGILAKISLVRRHSGATHETETPPESWPGWLRFRWSPLLDQDGVDFPGAMSNLLGTDLIIGNCARLRVVLFLFVVVCVAIILRAQVIRCNCRQIMLLQFFVTLPHFRRHLVEFLLRFDRPAEEQFSLRIFRRQKFLALFVFDPQLALVIGKNNLRPIQIDRGSLERAVISCNGANALSIAPHFVRGALRFIARSHHRVMNHSALFIAKL